MKKIKNIIICGCGNIGLRHAQGLAKSKYKINLFLIDKSQKKINFLIRNLNNNKNLKIVYQSKKIEKINKRINLLILSTDSLKRYELLKKILIFNRVEYIILEKFAFLKKKHFKDILSLNKKIWVNTPNRVYESYKKLKKQLKNKKINMEVTGNRWNMASNIIHYLDLFHFLNNFKRIKSQEIALDKKIFDSKRKGYKEISGRIKLYTETNNLILFEDSTNIKHNGVRIKIFNKYQNYLIDEKTKSCINGHRKTNFKIPFQSNLTNKYVNKIFSTGRCDLPKLKISSYLHIVIINILNNFTLYKNKNFFPVS